LPSDLSRLVRHEATNKPHFDQRRVQGRVSVGKNANPPEVVPPAGHEQSWRKLPPLAVPSVGRLIVAGAAAVKLA
jgi:hypothetical protein